MRVLKNILLGLLLACGTTVAALADTALESPAPPGNTGTEVSASVQALIDALNADIAHLEFLSARIDQVEKFDREVLVFRQDERSFRALADFNTLVKKLVALPDGSPNKEELIAQIIAQSDGVGDAIFNRITEIKQRITQTMAAAESMSGGALVATQAYIESLEATRINYYKALVAHLDNRKALGLSPQELRNRLDPTIKLYAETLAGRIESTAAARRQVRARLAQAPANADIKSALSDLNERHKLNLVRLETMLPLLDRLGFNSTQYKTILIQQAESISVNLFSLTALRSVFGEGWTVLKDAFKGNAPDIFFRLLIFAAVLFVFRILSRVTRRVVRAASDRSSLNMSDLLKHMLVSTSGGVVMGIGVLMALSQIGISLAPMLAGIGVAGFIIGFALQDTLGNFAAGAMILIYRPFDVNDFVEVTGASGLVKKMNLVSTTITTFDNQTLVVPNSRIWGDVIKNVTAQKERRVDMEFGISYGDDIEKAERVLHEIVEAHEKVLKQPEPTIRLHTLGDSSVNFIVRPWTKTGDYWQVYWDIMREVKLRFDKEGISIPFPQRDVHLYAEKKP